jgi:hypothetical protein
MPLDLYQAMLAAGMVAPTYSAADEVAYPTETTSADWSDAAPQADAAAPLDLYQAMLAAGMVAPNYGSSAPETPSATPAPLQSPMPSSTSATPILQRTPDESTIQREDDQPTSQAEQAHGLDLNRVARDVFDLLRRRLRRESERNSY